MTLTGNSTTNSVKEAVSTGSQQAIVPVVPTPSASQTLTGNGTEQVSVKVQVTSVTVSNSTPTQQPAPKTLATAKTYGKDWASNDKDGVQTIQLMLNSAMQNSVKKYYNNPTTLAVDGAYGPLTEGQVRSFQQYVNTVHTFKTLETDGIVGPHTWTALCYVASSDYKTNKTPANAAAYQAGQNAGCANLFKNPIDPAFNGYQY